MRFVEREGLLAHGSIAPGRGAYTCRRLACFERAVSRRAFARVLRRPVRVELSLTALYTDR